MAFWTVIEEILEPAKCKLVSILPRKYGFVDHFTIALF